MAIYGWSVVSIYNITLRCSSNPPPPCEPLVVVIIGVGIHGRVEQHVSTCLSSSSGIRECMWVASTIFPRTHIGQAVMAHRDPNEHKLADSVVCLNILNCVVEWLLSSLWPAHSCIRIRSHKNLIATIKQSTVAASEQKQQKTHTWHRTCTWT